MFSRRLPLVSLLFALSGLLAACGDARPAADLAKGAETRFAIRIGSRTVQMELAVRPEELQRGLMFRRSMGRDEGMLFVFMQPQQMGFWMRNTTLPLDIGYLDAQGVLREIYPLHPLDERSVVSQRRDLQFALEMNQGWFKERGVKPGDQLDLAALREALRERGFRAEAFGLR